MSEDRPLERKRPRRGLGARSVEGESERAGPAGRLGHLGKPGARSARGRRRTVRGNPDAD